MEITLRQETEKDHKTVFDIVASAFADMQHSDHREQFLVERLRKSKAFIPELSIVAESGNETVGHILLTRIYIDDSEKKFPSLAMAPVSVRPQWQGRGVGGRLIRESHRIAKNLGYNSIILLGHQDYYPRFGYVPIAKYGISLPFDVPAQNCMVIELTDGSLSGVHGIVVYAKEFYE